MAKIERLGSMPYAKFGSSDMMVSRVCAGTMMWGTFNKDEKMAHNQLDTLLRLGVNFIDTAEMYPTPCEGGKVTEQWIGNWLQKALADGKVQREKFYIATKANPSNLGAPDLPGRTKPHGLDAESLMASCKASIERLKCKYIDMYYLHWPTRNVPIFGCAAFYPDKQRPMPSFDKGEPKDFEAQVLAVKVLLDAGLIKHWALSNENNYGVTMFCITCDRLGVPRPICVQNDYSLNNRTFDSDCYEACHRFGLVSCHYGLLCGGVLSGKYLRDSPYAKKDGRDLAECRHRARPGFQPRYAFPASLKATERYAALAEECGLSPTELALAWANQQPHVGAVIIGSTNVRQVEECVGAIQIKALPTELLDAINAVHEAPAFWPWLCDLTGEWLQTCSARHAAIETMFPENVRARMNALGAPFLYASLKQHAHRFGEFVEAFLSGARPVALVALSGCVALRRLVSLCTPAQQLARQTKTSSLYAPPDHWWNADRVDEDAQGRRGFANAQHMDKESLKSLKPGEMPSMGSGTVPMQPTSGTERRAPRVANRAPASPRQQVQLNDIGAMPGNTRVDHAWKPSQEAHLRAKVEAPEAQARPAQPSNQGAFVGWKSN
ncbi:unnamed protein product [Effrenium voratum]|uniref:NADP-dependent oxidoreductase domain-containing protein n=1 Tax=Effrenium voratum TaxID=2562239 RepID=A0AA36JKH8_9DINO|nr:unnamed protein product [Effrenium voratum]